MAALAWTRRCQRRSCGRRAAWLWTDRDRRSWLCGYHAGEVIHYGFGTLSPLEAADRRYETFQRKAN